MFTKLAYISGYLVYFTHIQDMIPTVQKLQNYIVNSEEFSHSCAAAFLMPRFPSDAQSRFPLHGTALNSKIRNNSPTQELEA